MRKPWRIAALVLFAAALLAGGLLGDRLLALTSEARDSLRVYTELVNAAHDHYGAEVSYRDLVFASIQGLVRTLDPHTTFLPPKAYSGMRDRQQSTYYGLGILVSMRDGLLTVITPIEGTPASRLGIRAGDVISTIEGEPTDSMTLDEAVDKLKGPKGTQVNITITRRSLAEPLPFSITRAEIPQTTVRYAYMLAPEVGFMRITDFAHGTGGEVASALADLRRKGMQRLVLDLRNNGGGLLDQAVDVADQFVPAGSAIVETRGRTADSVQSYAAAGKFPPLDVPLVVLVNRGTASAAEILTGAIQDHDVGIIVGTPTWGKGLVQTVYNLSYGAGLALTTAKYYTPAGRLIQRDYSSFYDYYAAADQPDSGATPGSHVPQGPVYHTDLGRDVFGGGGITPDVLVEAEEISPFEQYLIVRNAYLNFAVDYVNGHPVKSQSWKPGPEVMALFKSWLVKESLAKPEEIDKGLAAPVVIERSLRQIHAEIFNAVFGQDAWHRVLADGDRQIQTGLATLPKAAELLAERRQLKPVEQRAGLPSGS